MRSAVRLDMTDARVKGFSTDKRVDLVDTREPGLTLRVTPSGVKTWAVRGRSSDGKAQRVTIGTYPEIPLSQARVRASEVRCELRETVGNLNQLKRKEGITPPGTPTLSEILVEYEEKFSPQRKTWQRPPRGGNPEAVNRIRTVFGSLLDRPITELTADELSETMMIYKPKSGRSSANGQVSRARAYLMPVLDWCASRRSFSKIGLGRRPSLDVADLQDTHDPSSDDVAITGERDRILDADELGRILPLLKYPAPTILCMKTDPENDIRPIALRFILLTACRISELRAFRWRDYRENRGEWYKPVVKTTRGRQRDQTLPLSDAAIELLRSLPGFEDRQPDHFVFPNNENGPLGNWTRICSAIMRESRTSDWHRHDLRRTSSTLMGAIGVAARIVDQILAHSTDHAREKTSPAIDSYLKSKRILTHIDDPQKVALDRLAEVLDFIEKDAGAKRKDKKTNGRE